MEITGKLVSKLPQQSGQGRNGTWVKQEFVLETQEQYPKKVCISLWGDKIRDLDPIQPGEAIRASIGIESREFNGRWYTDVRAWRLERVSAGVAGAATPPPPPLDPAFVPHAPPPVDEDLPF